MARASGAHAYRGGVMRPSPVCCPREAAGSNTVRRWAASINTWRLPVAASTAQMAGPPSSFPAVVSLPR